MRAAAIQQRRARKRLGVEMLWSMDELGFAGPGTIADVSVGGARIQLNRSVEIPIGTRVSLVCSHLPHLPAVGHVRWIRRTSNTTQCGIEFRAEGPQWKAWVAEQSAEQQAEAAAR